MASLSKVKLPNGGFGWRVTWYDSEGSQRSFWVGKTAKKTADRMLILVERLLKAQRLGLPLDNETAHWVNSLDDTLQERLSRLNLIPSLKKPSLGQVVSSWLNRPGIKNTSKVVATTAVKDVLRYFGEDKKIPEITKQHAEGFKQYLGQRKLRDATVSKRIGYARGVFNWAIQQGVIDQNPFAFVKHRVPNVSERRKYHPNGTGRTAATLLPELSLAAPAGAGPVCWSKNPH
ncbi:MAG: phage integrase SAM-like domain-containing protein [Candidatus Freyarchaeota archaeon]|nr:phage integrase SAM-like domain-containing protein [Candidatus Jordarchaeia archaeon]